MSVLFDTDMGPDVDDAGALAVLHTFADRGLIDLLGVAISTVGDGRTPAISFIDAVDTYYGRPDIPIGLYKLKQQFAFASGGYTADVASNPELFPHDLGDSNDGVPEATVLYRRVLAAAPDHSVRIVCTGPMNNLLALLDSAPDAESSDSGQTLVEAKVEQLVQMGGDYPAGTEFNFAAQPDPGTTAAAIGRWPTPIVFTGFALGASILTGASLVDAPAYDPVRRAYEVYTGSLGGTRQSWDLTAALFAGKATSTDFALSAPGRNQVDASGANQWISVENGGSRYLEARAEIPDIVAELNALIAAPPRYGRGH